MFTFGVDVNHEIPQNRNQEENFTDQTLYRKLPQNKQPMTLPGCALVEHGVNENFSLIVCRDLRGR